MSKKAYIPVKKFFSLLILTVIALMLSCDKPAPKDATDTVTIVTAPPSSSQSNMSNLIWPVGAAMLNKALQSAKDFNTNITELLNEPTLRKLQSAQQSWTTLAASTEQFYTLFKLGSYDAGRFLELREAQFDIIAWPIQPGYIDRYGEHKYSGIVFDISTPLTENALRNQHGLTTQTDVVTGIYAIEYLLFGERQQRKPLTFRSITALSQQDLETGYQTESELPSNRRRELLRQQSRMLIQDISVLRSKWLSGDQKGMATRYQEKPKENKRALLMQITQSTLTEQLLAIAQQQKQSLSLTPNSTHWRTQQLIKRISAQLIGLSSILNSASEENMQTLSKPVQECAQVMDVVLPPHEDGKPGPAINWRPAYECIRNIIRLLEH